MRPKMSGKPFVWGDKTSMVVTSSNPRELQQAWKAPAEQRLGRASQAQQKLPGWTAPAFTLLSEVLWKSGIRGQHPALPLGRSRGAALACCCCTGLWNREGPLCPSAAGVTRVTVQTRPQRQALAFKVLKYAFEERPLPGARREGQTHRGAAARQQHPPANRPAAFLRRLSARRCCRAGPGGGSREESQNPLQKEPGSRGCAPARDALPLLTGCGSAPAGASGRAFSSALKLRHVRF